MKEILQKILVFTNLLLADEINLFYRNGKVA